MTLPPIDPARRARLHTGMIRTLLGGLLALLACHAGANSFCANSQPTLQAAFQLAQISPNAFTIMVSKGDYLLPGFGASFSAPTSILGGYNADCSARASVPKASDTTIDFNGGNVAWYQNTGAPTAQLVVDGITLRNASSFYFQAGRDVINAANDSGDIHISRARISSLVNSNGGSQLVTFGGGSVFLDTVQLDHMATNMPNDDCSFDIDPYDSGYISLKHVTADIAPNKSMCFGSGLDIHDGSVLDIYNSIFWSSTGQSSTLLNTGSISAIHLYNSIYFSLTAAGADTAIAAPIQVPPQWVDGLNGNYHLQSTSPAVNSASPIPPGGLPATDIEGNARWIGNAPDRGAYESAFNTSTMFTVTNTSDSNAVGSGSLRDAINQANSLPNPATIVFNIPGSCPRTIALGSVLPKITSPIIIDGSTQPGSVKNTDPDAFDATLCVLVKPASGTLANAFGVAADANAASLTLRGLGIGGFSQPVQLLGGSNHVIAGNQFGGSVAGISLPGASFYAVTIGLGASGGLIVGGVSNADRNVIGDGAFGGINVQSAVASSPDKCQIVNNLIGLAPNGISALPNFTGIAISGSGCSINGNRIAGNSQDNIWISSGSNNVIQRNIIGSTINGLGFLNNSAGIRLTGASGNVIGSSATSAINGTFLANDIRFMGGGGVVVISGSDNSIRSNLIHDNGATGDGMDIDLGATGATPNDADDSDTGANNLQNFPLVDGIFYLGAPLAGDVDVPALLTANLHGQPGSYRIDAYFSNRCDNGATHVTGRGHADAYAGSALVTIPGGAGLVNFSMPVKLDNVLSSGIVSLTATDALGNTSEIGSCGFLSQARTDVIFRGVFPPLP